MKKSRLTDEQMVTILRKVDKSPVAEVAKKHGISEQTSYIYMDRSQRQTEVDGHGSRLDVDSIGTADLRDREVSNIRMSLCRRLSPMLLRFAYKQRARNWRQASIKKSARR